MDRAYALDLENDPLPFEFPGTERGSDGEPVRGVPEIWQLHWGASALEKRLNWLALCRIGRDYRIYRGRVSRISVH